MTQSIKSGAVIALMAGTLFAAACKKDEAKESDVPSTTTPPAGETAKPSTEPGAAAPAATAPGEKTAKVHCMGVNECKGQGGCKSAANDCSGKNGCKGKGFVDMASEEECKTKGGTVLAQTP